MTDDQVRAALTDRASFGVCLYGEVRGESELGRQAVASVIRNRLLAGKWGKTYRSVVFWPYQFSCWSPAGGAANYAVVMKVARLLLEPGAAVLPASYRACQAIADKAIAGTLEDPVDGATHYLTQQLYANHPPSWALTLTMVKQIGNHVFLK